MTENVPQEAILCWVFNPAVTDRFGIHKLNKELEGASKVELFLKAALVTVAKHEGGSMCGRPMGQCHAEEKARGNRLYHFKFL